MQSTETIIIGAGVSGLACARRLHEEDKEFIVISKDLGGRIKPSKIDPTISLGGVYINADYFNLMPFVDIIEPFRVRDFYFFDGKSYKTVFSLKNLKLLSRILRFMYLLWQFRNRLVAMRKKAEHEELHKLIESDPLLKKYWHMPVDRFLKQYGFEDLNHQFGEPTAGTNFFTTSRNINTFYYFFLFMSMIRPAYIVDMSKATEKMSRGFASRIILDTVISIEKSKNGHYLVKTEKALFEAKNIVIAAPYLDMKRAFEIPSPAQITSSYTYLVRGTRKRQYADKKGIVLHPDFHDAYLLWRQKTGEDLIYAKTDNLNLSKYYDDFVILEKIFWKTAAHLPKNGIIKQKLDYGLFLASDYNFSLMEDAFITGLYAANQIISSVKI